MVTDALPVTPCGWIHALSRSARQDDKREVVRVLSKKDATVALLLSLSYMTFVFSRVFVAAIAPAMQSDDEELEYTLEKHANLLVVVGIAYGVGKLVNGALVDAFHPIVCWVVYVVGSTTMVVFISLVNVFIPDVTRQDAKYRYLVGFAACNALFQSGGWPAMAKLIYFTFKPAQYGRVFSFLAVGSRTGSILTSLIVGGILSFSSWQNAARIMAAITFAGLIIFYLFIVYAKDLDHNSNDLVEFDDKIHKFDAMPPPVDHKPPYNLSQQIKKYCSWLITPQFMLMGGSYALLGLLNSFEGLLPIFLENTANPTSATAAAMGALLPFGIVASVIWGGIYLEQLNRRANAAASQILLFLLFLTSLGVTLWTAVVEENNGCFGDSEVGCLFVIGGLVLLFGFFLGYPYYIPPSKFALHFAGDDAAMATSIFDVFAAALSATFAAWGPALANINYALLTGVLSIASLVSFCLLWFFYYNEKKKKLMRQAGPRHHSSIARENGDEEEDLHRLRSLKDLRRGFLHSSYYVNLSGMRRIKIFILVLFLGLFLIICYLLFIFFGEEEFDFIFSGRDGQASVNADHVEASTNNIFSNN
eukprot:scaffold215824_cov58-Attheya_sp.AAC.2